MKVREVPPKRVLDRVSEMCSEETFYTLRLETAVTIIATARFLGFGKKRIQQYIKYMDDVRHEFLGYQADDILEEKIEEECRSLGFSLKELFCEEVPSHKELMRRSRAKKKNKVSIAQAHEMSQKIDAMKKFLEEQQKGA